jgi:monofunctional biosynthetic peptidoglycan transglycosylase
LKTRFPVVHYVKPVTTGRGQMAPAAHAQDFYVTIEKTRPPHWAPLAGISKKAMEAIIVSEDWAFYQHKGYDPEQIRAAVRERIDEGRMRGASTITQQVARNVFLTQDQNLFRKVAELVLAVRLEDQIGKRKILEVYLNIAEWGEGIFGIDEAARHYFGKSPKDLNAKEGAFLAMLLPSPKRYSQSFREKKLTDYANDTVEAILDKMVQAHWLTPAEKVAEWSLPLSFEKDRTPRVAHTPPEEQAAPAPDASPGSAQPAFVEAPGPFDRPDPDADEELLKEVDAPTGDDAN